ncbi:iron-containing alcohol dehydrogenase family protein [Parapusillimonas sp. JC17]|uniref:iron-containing alcohol dehydrogenase family protein n=1 Tax=Parapusillimonas sp. JC17 TaxID=3445768 RepID=UPI003FA0BF53
MLPDIDYHLFGAHVRFGPGCASGLPAELRALGCTRPVVLMQGRMAGSEAWRRLQEQLRDFDPHIVDTVPQHGSVELVESIAPRVAELACDGIVALGGGSVSDTAKALAMLLAEGGTLADHATSFTPPSTVSIPVRTRPKLPIISLPTTASGAEVTPSFGALQGDHKLLFWNRNVAGKTVLIDPDLSLGVPIELMQYTAMNGIAHCLEGMYSRHRSILSDGIALQSLELFARALADRSLCVADQRAHILLAGHLSGLVLSMARTCLHHAICHVIGARHNAGHGLVNTIILPHALRFNQPVVHEQLAPALALVNRLSGSQHQTMADWVAALVRDLGLPARLSHLGLADADLPAIAGQTLTERGLALNPRPVANSEDILFILRQAL